jgi:predicted PurR-regulated permease PerM
MPVALLAGISIVLLAMRAASEILAPIILAFILAISTTPLLYWFMKKGAPAWLALLLTIAVNVVIILLLVWLVGSSVQDFGETIAEYEDRFNEITQDVGGVLTKLGVDVDNLAADQFTAPEKLLEVAAGFAGGVVSGISNWGLIIMTSIFFLVEATIMPRKVRSVTQEGDPDVQRIFRLNEGLRQYMVINAGVGALAAVFNVILLFIMGIEFAVLWGVLAFFFSFVPNIGFIISVIPPAIMALLQFGVTEMLIVIGAYIIINFLVDNVIKPRFIEESVNISATMTFLSLIVWGWVLGPIGAILAVPMAIIVQAGLGSRKETRWLAYMAYMMGTGSEPFEPEEAEDDQNVLAEDVA